MKYWLCALLILLSCEKKGKNIDVTENSLPKEKTTAVELKYVAPNSWVEEETRTSMRKAQFRIPGTTQDVDGEMAVFHFPKMNVDPQANLDRWIRQFKAADGGDIKNSIERQDFEIKDMTIQYIKVDGIYKKSANPFMPNAEITELADYTMLAAIINTTNGPWFFKAVGPEKTMLDAKPDFEKMMLSVK